MSEYIVELNESPTITVDGWNVRCDDWLIQREPVVRCRDCCNGHQTPVRGFRCWHWLELDGNGDPVPAEVAPDGYCSYGERGSE